MRIPHNRGFPPKKCVDAYGFAMYLAMVRSGVHSPPGSKNGRVKATDNHYMRENGRIPCYPQQGRLCQKPA